MFLQGYSSSHSSLWYEKKCYSLLCVCKASVLTQLLWSEPSITIITQPTLLMSGIFVPDYSLHISSAQEAVI